MNVFQGCVLFLVGLVLSGVDAQIPTRAQTPEDKACGPGRYYHFARHTCWPY
ncbi:uncharacterized protein LOC108028141 [Drosophila biarmipes]|uniref:uncharacterized protein LOC108028141 n=1 Tax=Drosophila biarmipes TaxID=125945 RepID=UPI0007E6CB11|nr:uncharacterized protein LOC108028141 [Drosophila biarmipes]